jgi:hypothetical protein
VKVLKENLIKRQQAQFLTLQTGSPYLLKRKFERTKKKIEETEKLLTETPDE